MSYIIKRQDFEHKAQEEHENFSAGLVMMLAVARTDMNIVLLEDLCFTPT